MRAFTRALVRAALQSVKKAAGQEGGPGTQNSNKAPKENHFAAILQEEILPQFQVARNRCLDELRRRRHKRIVYFSTLEREHSEEELSPRLHTALMVQKEMA